MTSGLTVQVCRLAGPSIMALNSDAGIAGRLNSTRNRRLPMTGESAGDKCLRKPST